MHQVNLLRAVRHVEQSTFVIWIYFTLFKFREPSLTFRPLSVSDSVASAKGVTGRGKYYEYDICIVYI